ncbi:MAG: M28 family peptidase [Saprospiraceae bacterium]|nr:M28 family peptidase [Saprospiraceae bacterium]
MDNGARLLSLSGPTDHLGTGGSGSGLSTDVDEIHNGADDNASGVAGLLYIAGQLAGKDKTNNYLFIAFFGRENWPLRPKHYADNPTIDLATANYTINMDMVGRLDSVLVINGRHFAFMEYVPREEDQGPRIYHHHYGKWSWPVRWATSFYRKHEASRASTSSRGNTRITTNQQMMPTWSITRASGRSVIISWP